MEKVLEIFDQPFVEITGEAYLPITPETIKQMLVRINDVSAPHELSDDDCWRLCTRPSIMFQWIDIEMIAFTPYERVAITQGNFRDSYYIDSIDIGAPKVPVDGVEPGTECFVISIDY